MAKSKFVLLSGLSFLFGIFSSSLNWNFYLVAVLSAIFIFGISLYKKYPPKAIILVSIALFTFAYFYHNLYVNFQELHPQTESQPSSLEKKLIAFKEAQINRFRISLSSNSAALLSGETFGERGDFTPEFKNQMNRSGTTHIVALSGYNIAILVLAISTALGSFLSRKKTFFITVAIIVLFVIMVGGGASIIRAAIMGFFLLLAKELGRPHNLTNIIILTAVIMTLVNPTILTDDIGFELSFLSLLGIVYLEPVIKKILRLKERSSLLGWRENAVMTLSAQIAVAPILIHHFNQFSFSAIPANILILEVVPLTMFFGFLLAALSSIFQVLGFLAAKLVNILLVYQIEVIKIFSIIYVPAPNIFSSGLLIFIYYLILLGLIIHFSAAKNKVHQ